MHRTFVSLTENGRNENKRSRNLSVPVKFILRVGAAVRDSGCGNYAQFYSWLQIFLYLTYFESFAVVVFKLNDGNI